MWLSIVYSDGSERIWIVVYACVAIEVELMMMIVIDVIVIMVHPIKPRRLELSHEATVHTVTNTLLWIHVFVQNPGTSEPKGYPT
jgi:hypothetical protein